jgi:hypothetical protein
MNVRTVVTGTELDPNSGTTVAPARLPPVSMCNSGGPWLLIQHG